MTLFVSKLISAVQGSSGVASPTRCDLPSASISASLDQSPPGEPIKQDETRLAGSFNQDRAISRRVPVRALFRRWLDPLRLRLSSGRG
jgi:hypothetical protein